MIQIIPSILESDKNVFLKHLAGLRQSVSMVQIDIADGKFVPNKTWSDPDVVRQHLRMDCELHLMVAEPLKVAKMWTGVLQVKRILVHYEALTDPTTELLALTKLGWQVSLVLNPETPISVLDLNLDLNLLTGVQFMGVHPGKQGNPFIPEVLGKIRAFKASRPNHFIELDGGVNEAALPEIVKSGVDAVCPGSAIFGNERSPEENVERMKILIQTLTTAG